MLVDRLEELLAAMEDEDEEENEEDALALTDRMVPEAVPVEEDGRAVSAGGGEDERRGDFVEPGRLVGGTIEVEGSVLARGAERSGEIAGVDAPDPVKEPERFAGETAGVDGFDFAEKPGRAGEAVEEDASSLAERAENGPVWKLDDGAVRTAEAAWLRALADRQDEAVSEAVRMEAEGAVGAAAKRLSLETGEELARAVRHEAESGLEGLYRQAVQASRPAPQALPVEQAGRTVRAEEPGRVAALAVDELDRAVRRDSRRYDGGMMIF